MSITADLYGLIAKANPYLGSLPGYSQAVGYDGHTALRSFTTLTQQPGIYYNASSKTLVVSKDGTNLSNIDFRGVSVYVQANNVTLTNCTFDASVGSVAVRGMSGYANLTIDHCSFDGLKLDKSFLPIYAMGTNTVVTNSSFKNAQSDVISIASGRIADNLIDGSGYQTGAHADAISISGFKTNGPIVIENNVIDWRSQSDAKVETNQAIRVTSDVGSISGITVQHNVLLGGSYTIGIEQDWGGPGSIKGVKIVDNVIDAGKYGGLEPTRPADLVYHDNVHVTGPAPKAGPESVGPTVAAATAGLKTIAGTAGNDTLQGKDGAEYIKGGDGQDWISAGAGNDVIEGGTGRDYLTGGAGADTFVYRSFDPGRGDLIYDFVHGVDKVDLAELPGAPSLANGWTWLGTQTFTGDPWQLRYQTGTDGLTHVQVDRDGDMKADLDIEFSGSHSFTTADFILATTMATAAASSTASAAQAASAPAGTFDTADRITGTTGADVMKGGAGNTTYVVDNAGDQVIEAVGGGTDTVLAKMSYALGAGQEIENLFAADPASKTSITLSGNEFDNHIVGSAASQWLDGKAGADVMEGLGGDDTYLVDNARDVVIEAAGQGTDIVYTTVSYALAAGQEVEILAARTPAATTPLSLTGNEFANTVRGGAGNDVLDGGAGADILEGRGGHDTFVFKTSLGGGNVDHIVDFAAGDDRIVLDHGIFAGLAPGELDANAFVDLSAPGAKLHPHDRILYDGTTGTLSYDPDGSGSATATPFAVLDNKAVVGHHDFLIV